ARTPVSPARDPSGHEAPFRIRRRRRRADAVRLAEARAASPAPHGVPHEEGDESCVVPPVPNEPERHLSPARRDRGILQSPVARASAARARCPHHDPARPPNTPYAERSRLSHVLSAADSL